MQISKKTNPFALLALSLTLFAMSCSGTPKASKIDLATSAQTPLVLTPSSVTAYLLGPQGELQTDDLRPMMSEGEGYYEKWEMRVYSRPYEMRVNFEVASLGFGDYKGRVKGQVKKVVEGEEDQVYKFDKKLSESKWSYSKEGFRVEMGDHVLEGVPGDFHIYGEFKDQKKEIAYDFEVVGESWRPGTGVVAFGDAGDRYYRNHILSPNAMGSGTVTIDGDEVHSEGRCYGVHLGTNVGVHEMATRSYHFRRNDGDFYVEWRSFATVDQYNRQPFGFVVVSYKGVVLFESFDLTLSPHDFYTDPDNYGYAAAKGMTITAQNGDDRFVLTLNGDEVETSNPLAKLPALERSIAENFSKPTEFKVIGPWRLDLDVDGMTATVENQGSYSVTVYNP